MFFYLTQPAFNYLETLRGKSQPRLNTKQHKHTNNSQSKHNYQGYNVYKHMYILYYTILYYTSIDTNAKPP